jgi:hypothetical protein
LPIQFISVPGLYRDHSGNGPQCRAFAGTVGTDDGDDFTGVDIKADPVQGLDIAV